ncbi:hypothetical protein V6N12_009313 [Hibiscus sabdariffa]|uniref:Uncharacterized protein n=1 Tax=Hibiscus sabdariffa TaxID=183260 RepID=A0ABR2E8R6_9ROSI
MKDSVERLDMVDTRHEELDTQGEWNEGRSDVLESKLEALRVEMLDLKVELQVYQIAMKKGVLTTITPRPKKDIIQKSSRGTNRPKILRTSFVLEYAQRPIMR